MNRRQRFIALLLVSAATVPVVMQSHTQSRKEGVAFLPASSSCVSVKVTGTVPISGIYRFEPGATVTDVINLTAPDIAPSRVNPTLLHRSLKSGETVEINDQNRLQPGIRMGKMRAKERILLGIALDPDEMDVDDWQALPGIGPKMAVKIMEDRQNNGGFASAEALLRVPGIGEKKFEAIRKHFK